MMNGKWRRYNLQIACALCLLALLAVVGCFSPSLLLVPKAQSQFSPVNSYENIARGKAYTVAPKPNYPNATDPTGMQLTDGEYSSELARLFWQRKNTVGWRNSRPVVVTIDLGQVEPIRGVGYNTAAGTSGGVSWPFSISVLVSDDGKEYYPVGDLVAMSNKRGAPILGKHVMHRYWTDELRVHGRYVQLVIDAGYGFFCFADEIEVYKGEQELLAQPLTGSATAGGMAFFREKVTLDGIRDRLNADIQDVRSAVAAAGLSGGAAAPLLAELADLEALTAALPPPENPLKFRAVLPLNDIESRIFAVYGKLRGLQGRPPLQLWQSNPYDYIKPIQEPDNVAERLGVHMMRGEWRSAVINLTNSTDKPAVAQLHFEGLPGGSAPEYIDVFEVEWSGTRENLPIASALIDARRAGGKYSVAIPAGMVRQVWLSFHPAKLAPGRYSGRVSVTSDIDRPSSIPVDLQVSPIVFPVQPTLHMSGWDYTDGYLNGVTPGNRNALVSHLQERFVDSPWAVSEVLARGAFDVTDSMRTPSTERFDEWVARWPKARRYMVFVNAGNSFGGAQLGTTSFDARVRSWIRFWANHAASKGIKPEQIVLLLWDEPRSDQEDKIITSWSRAIRAAQTGVVIWEDPNYKNPRLASPEVFAAADILTPNRIHMMSGGADFADFYRQQRAAGRRLELYSCEGPMHVLDPYSYIRLQAWECWSLGAGGTTFWSFGDTGGGSPWQPYAIWKKNYSPLFLTSDAVIGSKHMEAMRESVEDYEYFVMLQKAVERAGAAHPAAPRAKELLANGARRVLDAAGASDINWSASKDRWQAEKVRTEILRLLEELEQR